MAERDLLGEINALDETLRGIEQVLDISRMQSEVERLENEAGAPDLWNNPENAQRVTSALSRVQGTLNKVRALRGRVTDLPVMIELADAEGNSSAQDDVIKELDSLSAAINDLEVQTLLSGEYDHRDALITIRSEAGGVDAADWAEMVSRMFFRYCERHNYGVSVLETSYGEEAGIKSTTFKVIGPYCYGTLSVEQGTHRLVRISPFDSQNRRHT
ncbi:MAG: PCRF domain-containing protein, partial [Actinobacteria bacterium]|nr:PCRF domain-containing protein [Actinomycetota bacterium]